MVETLIISATSPTVRKRIWDRGEGMILSFVLRPRWLVWSLLPHTP
jgi:hypothetical protein